MCQISLAGPIKVYKKRYLMGLFLFVAHIINAFQCLEYSSITKTLTYYYDVKSDWVDFTATMFSICCPVLIFPATKLIEVQGLRFAFLVGSFLNCFGACVKCFGVPQNMFGVMLLGQICPAIGQVFIYNVSPFLAAVWFKTDEVAKVNALCFAADLIGRALIFCAPKWIFKDLVDKTIIQERLGLVSLTLAAVSTLTFLLVVIFAEEKPKTPPSHAERNKLEHKQVSLRELFQNTDYVLLLINVSITFSVPQSFAVVLNQMLFKSMKAADDLVTTVGLILACSGFCGAVAAAYYLDKYKKFKRTAMTSLGFSMLSMIMFTAVLELRNIQYLYIATGVFGFSMFAFVDTIPDVIVELTYPMPEYITIGIVFLAGNTPPLFLVPIYTTVLTRVNVVYANGIFCTLLSIAFGTLLLMKWRLKRVAADHESIPLFTPLVPRYDGSSGELK